MSINSITPTDISEFSLSPNLDAYQRIATKSAIYPGKSTPLGLAYVALKMNGEAGEFAEHVGKAMRDDGLLEARRIDENEVGVLGWDFGFLDLKEARRALLIKEVGDVLWYLSAACNELGITLGEAALENLKKLSDRSARGKLQGSGDDR
jgi:NTP pyrophosphatase (non-canonical NTP hydrolase)